MAAVLDVIAGERAGLRAIDIAERLRLPQASAYRLLRRLEAIGYLESSGRDPTYTVGPRLRSLTQAVHGHQATDMLVDAAIRALADATGMSAYVAGRTSGRVVLVATRPPSIAEGAQILPGSDFPAHATACGRALLAFQSDTVVDAFLGAAELVQITDRTITDAKQFKAELAKIRKQGYATMRGELGNGLWALAAPIPAAPHPVFSVGVVTFETNPKTQGDGGRKLAQLVMRTAADLRDVLRLPTGANGA
jgi:IclR family pca regulon transcriptional regulator